MGNLKGRLARLEHAVDSKRRCWYVGSVARSCGSSGTRRWSTQLGAGSRRVNMWRIGSRTRTCTLSTITRTANSLIDESTGESWLKGLCGPGAWETSDGPY
jgi:hypothetical protein